MRTLRSPAVWYPAALLLVIWLGATLLRTDACVQLSDRDRTAYGARPLWLATFDAVSATCSVGLTLFDLREQYTPRGRWVLLGLTLIGVSLHYTALTAALWRRTAPAQAPVRTRTVLIRLTIIFLPVACIIALHPWTDLSEARLWQRLAAVIGSGLTLDPTVISPILGCAALIVALLAWFPWMFVGPSRAPRTRTVTAYVLSTPIVLALHLAIVFGAAHAVDAFESPRAQSGWRGHGTQRETGPNARPPEFDDRFNLVFTATHAGIATQPLADRAVSEGTKLILAAMVLLGALGGVTGGIGMGVVLAALTGGCGLVQDTAAPETLLERQRLARAARRIVGATLALTFITTLGLLWIESRVASRFEAPATLGDAVLDAASVVGGAGLTSGLIENLTSAHLSKGMGQTVDSYLYATVWVMLAMFAGRIVPILALATAGSTSRGRAPSAPPPSAG